MAGRRTIIVTATALIASAISRGLRGSVPLDIIGYVSVNAPVGDELARRRPDVVIVDDARGFEVALDRVAEARRAAPRASLILLSSDMDHADLARAADAGVDAAVRRSADAVRVGALVRDVLAGDVYHAFSRVPTPAARPASAGPVAGLTGRELEILRLVAAGSSNGTIARGLWITEQTVKFHLSNVYRKLGVSNRTQASRFALLHGVVDDVKERRDVPTAA